MAESITITDNRTGESIEVPILDGGVDSTEWRKLLPGVWFYDPALMTTAATSSKITELDGENGILRYRGYPIEQLAEKSSYLEVAYLLIHGELPDAAQFEAWKHDITYHTYIHENVRKRFLEGFHYDAHPMGMLVSAMAALSTFYPEAGDVQDPANRYRQIVRLIAKMPTLAAACHRFSVGMPFVYPDNSLGFSENFLSMLWKIAEPRYDANPALARALDVLFILHADHEQNCGTTAMRTVGSAHADPYVSTASAAAALYGPRHGGANEDVIHMLTEIGSLDQIPAFIESVKQGQRRMPGFGHRVYKSYDPRATIITETADEVFAAADVLTLHLPVTPETRGSIGAEACARMRDGVRIVNAARGELVDEDALLEALTSGKVAGAALDVFGEEPYAGPLLDVDSVVVTPHLAASTAEAQDRAGVIVAEQVAAALEGGLVTNAVNIPAIGPEDMEVLGPFVPLAAKLGRLAMELAAGRAQRIELAYFGTLAEYDARLLTVAALNGAFQGRTEQAVNYVNAPFNAATVSSRVSYSDRLP